MHRNNLLSNFYLYIFQIMNRWTLSKISLVQILSDTNPIQPSPTVHTIHSGRRLIETFFENKGKSVKNARTSAWKERKYLTT